MDEGQRSDRGVVHVRRHMRGGPGGRVDVDDHDRAYPGEGPLGLRGVVGNGRANRPEDVTRVKRAMTRLGRYPKTEEEPNGYIDRPLDDAIGNYQADRRLRRDGWMAPDGETARALDRDAGLLRLTDLADHPASPRVVTSFPLTPRKAEADMRGHADAFGAAGRLGETLGIGDLGFNRARDHLNHYLGNAGTAKNLTSKEVDEERIFESAEQVNRVWFESATFLGRNSRGQRINQELLNLANGQSTKFSDNFEAPPRIMSYVTRPGAYFAFGRTSVRSDGDFMAKRVGDRITILGEVTHQLDNKKRLDNARDVFGDTYNFTRPQPGGREAEMLEPINQAKPFEMTYIRRQRVTAVVRRDADGGLTLEKAS